MSRNTQAVDSDQEVDPDQLDGEEVDDGLELDLDEWDDESTGGDPVEAPQEPAEPAPDPEPTTKPKTSRGRK
jgi:hypothetical protein